MTSLVVYSSVIGGFYVKSDALEKAIDAAKTSVGDDVWKRGFSATDPAGATAAAKRELMQAGIDPIKLEGELTSVSFTENKDDSGNLYPKLRVDLLTPNDKLVVSLDLKSDVAQRMIAKLDNCKPGDRVSVSAWPTTVEKGDRTFINHAVSMRNSENVEIPVNPNVNAKVKEETQNVEKALMSAGVDDKKVINAAKTTKRIAVNKEVLQTIETRFKPQV